MVRIRPRDIHLKRLFVPLCCVFLLASCGGYGTYTPKKPGKGGLEPTQRPYTVMGKKYTPLYSHDGFSQTGIASWYGKKFHGRSTSNGETYNMYAMTAAHKTLPMNVYVEVKNRSNGRSTVVRINDRGPFVRGRIIDLSYAAAKKLGVATAGTAPVRIRALGYKEARSAKGDTYRAPADYDAGTYTVQVGAFTIYKNAKRLSTKMKRDHGYSDIRKTRVDDGIFFRVYAGKYDSLRRAEDAAGRFEEDGFPGSFVVALE